MRYRAVGHRLSSQPRPRTQPPAFARSATRARTSSREPQSSSFSQGYVLIFLGQSSQDRDANAPEPVARGILARPGLKKPLEIRGPGGISQAFQLSLDGGDHHGEADFLIIFISSSLANSS